MPIYFDKYKKRVSGYDMSTFNGNPNETTGNLIKKESDAIMDETWWNDPQSRICYIYDYYHDDQPHLNYGMTYDETTKTKIDAKFMIKTHGSMAKDQVEVHIMFKPNQKYRFDEGDELYYLETDYRQRYRVPDVFIGAYIDIPNQNGVYEKWMICLRDTRTQFQKYFILPCDYYLHWIEETGEKRIKRKMWCVTRNQNSYNSGLWTDYYFTSEQNQNKLFLPMNPITEKLFYTSLNDGQKRNKRLIVSALVENPICWNISKNENHNPFGLQKVTLAQDAFNRETDYVNLETGEMYADYYSSSIEPVEIDDSSGTTVNCTIGCSTNNIKAGGSYKLLTATFIDSYGEDVTEDYGPSVTWKCYIDDTDITETELVAFKHLDENNKIRIKFADDKTYLGQILKITCESGDVTGSTELEIISV